MRWPGRNLLGAEGREEGRAEGPVGVTGRAAVLNSPHMRLRITPDTAANEPLPDPKGTRPRWRVTPWMALSVSS